MSNDNSEFQAWAIIEVMGHRTYAGRVSEQRVAGVGFVRIEIPEADGFGEVKLIGPRSIFAVHLTSEENARAYTARATGHAIDLFAKFGPTMPALCESDDWEDGERAEIDVSDVPF